MKRNFLVSKILVFCLIIMYLLNTTACFKRIPIVIDYSNLPDREPIYISLNSHEVYKIYGARLSDGYLVGYRNSKQGDIVRISISEIESVEVVRPDEKKIWRNIGVGLTIFIVAGFILFKDYDKFRED